MENYKADYYNPETFEKSEIETKIPSDLVSEVKQSLDKMEGYFITPTIINPEELSVVWGIMDNTNTLKYKLSITPIHQSTFIKLKKNMENTKFKIGDKAYKPKGYKFPCTIVSVFKTVKGNIRVVAEMDEFGLLHIFNEEQLEHYP